MRMHDRSVVLVALVLLTGVLSARPAGSAGAGFHTGAAPAQPSLRSNTPPRVQLDFGTVVRDTADEQSLDPGRNAWYALQRQMSPQLPFWVPFLCRCWSVLPFGF